MKLLPVPLAPVSLPPPGQPPSHPSTPTLLHPHQSQLPSHHHHHHQQHAGGPYSPSAADFSFWRYPSSQLSAYAAAAAAAGANGAANTGSSGVPLIAPVPALSGLAGGPAGVTTAGTGPLPPPLGIDPRLWGREDVAAFLRWCEREFDLREFDMDAFQMNGKAMCLLTKNDLSERCPGAGDVLYNALQMLVRDAALLQRCLPGSPVTPTSRHHAWPHLLATAQDAAFHGHLAAAAHFASQQHAAAAAAAASVALSPAPSLDSQQGSPQHADQQQQLQQQHTNGSSSTTTAAHQQQQQGSAPTAPTHAMAASMYQSNGRSDSEDDECQDTKSALSLNNGVSPPGTPGLPPPSGYMSFSMQQAPPRSPVELKSPAPFRVSSGHGEFFQNEPSEPNTNGRLLWDFLQQLLNDSSQRYTNYIAWKNIETGVFKIVDPAGLAKLWGIQKNHLSMNYDKMSRALRYYYRVNILRKVQGERHCYQFLRNPSELKNIKNISLLRQQMSPTRVNSVTPAAQQQSVHSSTQQQHQHQLTVPTPISRSSPNVNSIPYTLADVTSIVKSEPRGDDVDVENHSADDEMPTDLSMMSSSNNSEMRATDLSAKYNGHRIDAIVNGNHSAYDTNKVDSDTK